MPPTPGASAVAAYLGGLHSLAGELAIIGVANRNHRRLGLQWLTGDAWDHCTDFEESDPQSLHVGAYTKP